MRKLLVVEDNETMQKILKHYFQDDFEVILKSNGSEAINWMKNIRPDIIIADIEMPIMDGFEFIKIVRSFEKLNIVPIVVLSYLNDLESKRKCMDAGANDYFVKPFLPAKLSQSVNKLLGGDLEK